MSRSLALLVLCVTLMFASVTPATAAPEGTLTFALHYSLPALDPADTDNTITPFLTLYAVHDGLLKPMAGAPSAPSLAESWSMARDGLSAEFTLRQGLRFHKLGIFWLDFPEQWDPKSPWHDKRVRMAASLALDRQSLNQAETLGLSRPVGSVVPRDFEFALPFEPDPYDPARAKRLLAEAGYPSGFDAGDFTPFPPYNSMGETLSGWLQAVGIRTKMRIMERATFMASWREKKHRGVVLTITGISGNAATRLEPFVTSTGASAYGALPEVDDLFKRQARELDKKKREAMLHQIQRVVYDQVLFAPVYHLGFPIGMGPRVEDILANPIPGFYMAPYEDLKLKLR